MTATPRALHIAMISEHASPLSRVGDSDAARQSTYVAQAAEGVASMGHHVDVLTRRDDPWLPNTLDVRPRYRVLYVDAGPREFVPEEHRLQLMPAFSDAAGRLLDSGTPYDVIHANFFTSGWVGMQLKRRFRVPLVTTFHSLGRRRSPVRSSTTRPLQERIDTELALMHQSDRVLAEGPDDRLDMLGFHDVERSRLAIVSRGVDLAMMAPVSRAMARRRLGLAADEFIVLQLAPVAANGAIDTVIRAVARFDPAERVRLVVAISAVAGSEFSSELTRLHRVALTCGVAARIDFVGHPDRGALRDWYSAADVFVSTPCHEPYGAMTLEAMACATPVIGSKGGAVEHAVLDSVTGYVVPRDDPQALHHRLANLQAQPMLARAMGMAGRLHMTASFSGQSTASSLASIYRQVARRDGREPSRQHASGSESTGLTNDQTA